MHLLHGVSQNPSNLCKLVCQLFVIGCHQVIHNSLELIIEPCGVEEVIDVLHLFGDVIMLIQGVSQCQQGSNPLGTQFVQMCQLLFFSIRQLGAVAAGRHDPFPILRLPAPSMDIPRHGVVFQFVRFCGRQSRQAGFQILNDVCSLHAVGRAIQSAEDRQHNRLLAHFVLPAGQMNGNIIAAEHRRKNGRIAVIIREHDRNVLIAVSVAYGPHDGACNMLALLVRRRVFEQLHDLAGIWNFGGFRRGRITQRFLQVTQRRMFRAFIRHVNLAAVNIEGLCVFFEGSCCVGSNLSPRLIIIQVADSEVNQHTCASGHDDVDNLHLVRREI